jgi:KDO2-lipid IV(A) lauroyltransferase
MKKLPFYLIKIPALLLSFLPYALLHLVGRALGYCLYYCLPKFRKRSLSNLSLAKDLKLSDREKKAIAKASFGSLMITCLEYAKFGRDPHLEKRIICENKEEATKLMEMGRGVIFFCAHQANWEALFLEGTMRMRGVAIGNEMKNPYLTTWINGIRERFGGKIISPKEALKEGMRALKQGKFLGIVGDQGLPNSGYYSSFLGTMAWTSPAPAMLCYKMNAPLIYSSIERVGFKYKIHYSDPIFPDKSRPMQEEIERMMSLVLSMLEKSIQKKPGEWMWQHNRWKQEAPTNVYYRFRHDTILVLLSEKNEVIEELFKTIYPKAMMRFIVANPVPKFIDYSYKLVFNFTGNKRLSSHFKKQSALEVLSLKDLKKIAFKNQQTLSSDIKEIILKAICRPEFFKKFY